MRPRTRILAPIVDASLCSVEQYDVIGIDEGQFYPDLVEMVEQWVEAGKVVLVAALDGDFRRKPFGRVLELVPNAVTRIRSGSHWYLAHPAILPLSLSLDRSA